jgi:hypothetical protein
MDNTGLSSGGSRENVPVTCFATPTASAVKATSMVTSGSSFPVRDTEGSTNTPVAVTFVVDMTVRRWELYASCKWGWAIPLSHAAA